MVKTYQGSKRQGWIGQAEEAQVLKMAAAGDLEAREQVLRHYAHLVGFCVTAYHLVGGDREDLYQEGMIGLLKAVEVFRPDRNASFRTFAQVCIRRQILTAVKRASRKKHGPLNQYVSIYKPLEEDRTMLADILPAAKIREPESVLMYRETMGKVKQTILSELTELERKVLFLHMEGNDYGRIGSLLKKDPKSVDNALQRSKRKLARRIGGNYS